MKHTLTSIAACLLAMAFLAGCQETGGSGLGSFFNSDTSSGDSVASLPSTLGGSYTPAAEVSGSSGDVSGDTGGGIINPEPATLGLLGSGLLAYALIRRRKKNKK
jgi:hypothetical protein